MSIHRGDPAPPTWNFEKWPTQGDGDFATSQSGFWFPPQKVHQNMDSPTGLRSVLLAGPSPPAPGNVDCQQLPVLSTLHTSPPWSLTATVRGENDYYPHFTDEETEALTGDTASSHTAKI